MRIGANRSFSLSHGEICHSEPFGLAQDRLRKAKSMDPVGLSLSLATDSLGVARDAGVLALRVADRRQKAKIFRVIQRKDF